jgi:hypothetical protein
MRTRAYCNGGVWLMGAALGLLFSGEGVSSAIDAEASGSGSERDSAERYWGDYEFSSGYLVSVRGNANGLIFRGAGQPATALLPTSAMGSFLWTSAPAQHRPAGRAAVACRISGHSIRSER